MTRQQLISALVVAVAFLLGYAIGGLIVGAILAGIALLFILAA